MRQPAPNDFFHEHQGGAIPFDHPIELGGKLIPMVVFITNLQEGLDKISSKL